MTPTDLAVGTAAEHLVCFDLLMGGYRAFLADQNCPYDVAVEIDGRLVRIQVKSTRCPRLIPQRANPASAYLFHVRRAGKGGARVYGDGEFDALALVALDIKRIAYMPQENSKQTVHIRVPDYIPIPGRPGKSGKSFDEFSFGSALECMGINPL